MARMAKNNDALVDAINRMAAAQEASNQLISEANHLHRQSLELNSKQYTLNIDNHKYNLERDDLAAQYKAGVEEAMDSAKKYIDDENKKLFKAVQDQISIVLSAYHRLENEVAEKANQNEVAQSIAQRMMKSIKGKGLI